MSAEIVQFVPRPRRKKAAVGPKILVPNAIEEVFQRAIDTAPSEMNPEPPPA